MESAKEKLHTFIEGLTPDQAAKLVARMRLLELLPTMTRSELIYTETFTAALFSKPKNIKTR